MQWLLHRWGERKQRRRAAAASLHQRNAWNCDGRLLCCNFWSSEDSTSGRLTSWIIGTPESCSFHVTGLGIGSWPLAPGLRDYYCTFVYSLCHRGCGTCFLGASCTCLFLSAGLCVWRDDNLWQSCKELLKKSPLKDFYFITKDKLGTLNYLDLF